MSMCPQRNSLCGHLCLSLPPAYGAKPHERSLCGSLRGVLCVCMCKVVCICDLYMPVAGVGVGSVECVWSVCVMWSVWCVHTYV